MWNLSLCRRRKIPKCGYEVYGIIADDFGGVVTDGCHIRHCRRQKIPLSMVLW